MSERPLDAELAPALDEAELAQVWRRVRDAQAEARVAPRRWRYAVATTVAVAAAVTFYAWPRGRTAPPPAALTADVAMTPGTHLDAPAARAIALADGSRVALAPDAALEVLANDGDRFVTAVRRGKVDFEVKPGGPRRWIIETDLATVEVIGTAFAVERAAHELAVTVRHGVVMVRGERVPGRIVRLTAGQHLEVPASIAVAPPSAIAPTPPVIAAAPPVIAPTPPAIAPTPPVIAATPPVAVAPASPRTATPRPAVAVAPTPVAPTPAPPVASEPPATAPPPPPPAPAAIIRRADELSAAGDHTQAAAELARFLADAPDDATAGLAAFLLGRIAQDHLGDPARAAGLFARVRAIGSPRAIQEEALVRQARSLARAGQRAAAQDAAHDYLTLYPRGARRDEMAALAAP